MVIEGTRRESVEKRRRESVGKSDYELRLLVQQFAFVATCVSFSEKSNHDLKNNSLCNTKMRDVLMPEFCLHVLFGCCLSLLPC